MQLTMDERESLDTIVTYAERELANGRGPKAIRGDLVTLGLPASVAREVVTRARGLGQSDIVRAERRRRGAIQMAVGGGLAATGGIISAATYSAAGGGDSYVVMTGLIAVGIISFFTGVFQVTAR